MSYSIKNFAPIRVLATAATLLLAVSIPLAAHADGMFAAGDAEGAQRTIKVDVVQNATDFFFEGPVNENGFPAKGTPFVTTGYIYRAGTLDLYGRNSGILLNGEPQFPERVIGTWICRGWHLLDGDAETGVVVVTTQSFDFITDSPGSHMLVTDGIELADFDRPFVRPIIGGSGKLGNASGEMRQTYLDFNESGGFNMTFEIDLD